MIAAHIDEPSRLLLEAETHGHLWSWVLKLFSNIRQFGNNTEAGQVPSLPVGCATQLGAELATSRMLSSVGGESVDGPSIGRQHQTVELLFTQQALVRVIANSECCQ